VSLQHVSLAEALRLRLTQSHQHEVTADWAELAAQPQTKPAAVLVPVVLRSHAPTVLFTRRTDHLQHHPGQISFPGGQMEASDTSPQATALRETEEEIGVTSDHVELLGTLPDYFTGTGFRITPVVGIIQPPFELRLDTFEVAEAFEVPLAYFLDPANHQRHSLEFKGVRRHFHAMPYQGYHIWGATAGILMSLYNALQDEPPLDDDGTRSRRPSHDLSR
jgi:8-oxo-dGTP pyrophosphatase MutT (NUDIX family)